MKLVSYRTDQHEHLGIFIQGKIYNLAENALSLNMAALPDKMGEFLVLGEKAMQEARNIEKAIKSGNPATKVSTASEVNLIAPVPSPTSCRDGYAFRQHVEAARRNRKVPMIPEFDQYPIFYFTNHNAIQGPGEIFCMPDHFQKLDFELEKKEGISKLQKLINTLRDT